MRRTFGAFFASGLIMCSGWTAVAGPPETQPVIIPVPEPSPAPSLPSTQVPDPTQQTPVTTVPTPDTHVSAEPAFSARTGTAYLGYDLPDLGGPADAIVSKSDEFEIGRMALKQMRDQNMVLEDPEIQDYIQQLGMRLASQAHDEGQTFTYNVLREPIVNAFATFGGIVMINSGLILLTDNESQLAAVIAHETGHVVQRHMARAIEAESRMSLASTAAMLAAILIGAASGAGGQAIEGAMAMGQAVAFQQAMNYTRSQEIEADAVGIELLANAGFDPNEMASFFESMSRNEGLAMQGIPSLLVDHPVTSERIAAARNRAASFPQAHALAESPAFEFIKERIRVLVSPPEARLDQWYASLRDRRPLTPAERYGQALVQIQENRSAAAVPTLRELQKQYPQMTMLYAALGQGLVASGQMQEALTLYQRATVLFPRNVPITIHYAEALIQDNQAAQAHSLLLDLFNNVDPSPAQIRLTAIAANAAGDSGDAYEYMAEFELAGGQLALANQQLELALASPNLTNQQKAKFRARLDQVRGWLREQQQSKHGQS
ncbi:MAG TPA: M48 family metalloprotease [Steroidobacteraceae bacterium]|jgi:predicted Zn-dependent protease|nr:M48 family metalloprotease [Steroidobacteraceae bacterium]